MRKISIFICLVIPVLMQAQKNIPTTESFSIEGQVKTPLTFSLKEAAAYPTLSLDSIVITNHLLQKRSTIRQVKGILLKDILNKVSINTEDPKTLSEYYLVCIASDGYKVVFSWNELFNSGTGNNVLIITEKDGVKAGAMHDRIALISPTDQATGRRFVKGLTKILIEKVQ